MSEDSQSGTHIPDQVTDLLGSTQIGYLSVTSQKTGLYSYPVAYYYSNRKVYMMTPIGSAKMKFMKANPNVSFLVDNKKLALDSCGAMIQGRAKILSMGKMIASIISLGPKMRNFAKKYPGMFTFYAKGKYLPDERKLYKYRFIRIDPSKIVYWTGYTFGKYLPEKALKSEELDLKEESNVDSLAGLLATADEELEPDKLPADQDWISELRSAEKSGILSDDEVQVIGMHKAGFGMDQNVKPGVLSSGEKSILKKWKSSKS